LFVPRRLRRFSRLLRETAPRMSQVSAPRLVQPAIEMRPLVREDGGDEEQSHVDGKKQDGSLNRRDDLQLLSERRELHESLSDDRDHEKQTEGDERRGRDQTLVNEVLRRLSKSRAERVSEERYHQGEASGDQVCLPHSLAKELEYDRVEGK